MELRKRINNNYKKGKNKCLGIHSCTKYKTLSTQAQIHGLAQMFAAMEQFMAMMGLSGQRLLVFSWPLTILICLRKMDPPNKFKQMNMELA